VGGAKPKKAKYIERGDGTVEPEEDKVDPNEIETELE